MLWVVFFGSQANAPTIASPSAAGACPRFEKAWRFEKETRTSRSMQEARKEVVVLRLLRVWSGLGVV
jgi:hypothetical protein